jgi:hypothetical protein
MATIIVEDGTGLANSTSYASEADLTTYTGERNVTLGGTNGTASEVLILAMDYIESKDFIGDKGSKEQALQWPRTGAQINGYYIESDEMPTVLLEAQMEIAIAIDGGVNPLANVPRETTKEKVDVIEVQYSTSAHAQTYLKAAETKLERLVRPTGMAFRV